MYLNPSIASIKRYHLSDDSPAHDTPNSSVIPRILIQLANFKSFTFFPPRQVFHQLISSQE